MSGIGEMLQGAAVFGLGLLVRLGLFVLILAAIAAPALLAIAGYRGLRTLYRRRSMERAGRVAFRRDVWHTAGHTWLQPVRAGALRLGVDDVARRLFSTPSGVRLPALGTHVQAGERVASIAASGHAASVASPVDGTVTAVNRAVCEVPGLLSDDPYFDGWLVEIGPDAPASRPAVLAAGPWLRSELARLTGLVEHELGMAAADGGGAQSPALEALSDEQWSRVATALLRSDGSGQQA
jgi:glycine cleavage system H protein